MADTFVRPARNDKTVGKKSRKYYKKNTESTVPGQLPPGGEKRPKEGRGSGAHLRISFYTRSRRPSPGRFLYRKRYGLRDHFRFKSVPCTVSFDVTIARDGSGTYVYVCARVAGRIGARLFGTAIVGRRVL